MMGERDLPKVFSSAFHSILLSLLQRFLNKASIRLEMMCAPCLWGKLHSDSFLFSHVTAKYDCWLPALCVSTWLHDYCLLQLCIFFILFNLVMHQVATFGAEKWSQALKTRVVTAVKHQWICKLLHWSSMYICFHNFFKDSETWQLKFFGNHRIGAKMLFQSHCDIFDIFHIFSKRNRNIWGIFARGYK